MNPKEGMGVLKTKSTGIWPLTWDLVVEMETNEGQVFTEEPEEQEEDEVEQVLSRSHHLHKGLKKRC